MNGYSRPSLPAKSPTSASFASGSSSSSSLRAPSSWASSSTPSFSSASLGSTSSPQDAAEPASPSAFLPIQTVMSSSNENRFGHSDVTVETYSSPPQRRNVETGSQLWSDGMRGLMTSLTGAPSTKSRNSKHSDFEPVRTSEVEAATSAWNVNRDTVAMTMGYQDSYENPNFQPNVWPASQMHNYAGSNNNHQPSDSSNFSNSYPNPPTPSGLPGDAFRSRPGSDASLLSDRRRPVYPNSRPLSVGEAPIDTHPTPWWSEQISSQVEDPSNPHPHYTSVNRRSNPPPLPETRRSAWNGPTGLEMGSYEFPQNNLGKREHEEQAFESNAIADPNDAASRRYSLAPGMSFSRPSAPISGIMNNYRPNFANDPRRPSLPADPYGMPQQQQMSHVGRSPYGGNPSQWSPWGSSPTYPSAMGMAAPSSSPNPQAWRDGGVRYSGIEAVNASPGGMAGAAGPNKKHQRGRSSSAASALQQASALANTPFHVTADIVLRALPGSKMDDVFYDQHCEIQTGMPDPPATDFETENEEDRPRLQTDKLRFPGDLYTPRWVRGSGNSREAWCDRCENGNWLQLKNSQYWYDQVHKHGVSSVSGLRFTAPTHLKVYSDAAGTIEGKCHHCKEWILICTAKRRRNFSAFFKHAHACHSYRKASAVGNGPIVEHNPGGYRNKKE